VASSNRNRLKSQGEVVLPLKSISLCSAVDFAKLLKQQAQIASAKALRP